MPRHAATCNDVTKFNTRIRIRISNRNGILISSGFHKVVQHFLLIVLLKNIKFATRKAAYAAEPWERERGKWKVRKAGFAFLRWLKVILMSVRFMTMFRPRCQSFQGGAEKGRGNVICLVMKWPEISWMLLIASGSGIFSVWRGNNNNCNKGNKSAIAEQSVCSHFLCCICIAIRKCT